MKLSNLFGNGNPIKVNQTYHTNFHNRATDLVKYIRPKVGDSIYASGVGIIGNISTKFGSYNTLILDNSDIVIVYVHDWNWKVKVGDRVKNQQVIAEMAPSSANGRNPPHIHYGIRILHGKYRNIMDYMDRDIKFYPAGKAIADDWFNGKMKGPIDWSNFEDLSYNNKVMGKYKIGDKVEFTNTAGLRVRTRPTTSAELVLSIKSNTKVVSRVKSNPIEANGYIWYFFEGLDWAGWAVQKWSKTTTRVLTDRNGEIPQSDCSECEGKLENANEKVVVLGKKVIELNNIIETFEPIEDLSTEFLLATVDKRVSEVEL